MIDTNNLTKKFGNNTAVENLTINIKEGEVFGFYKNESIKYILIPNLGIFSSTSEILNS